MEHGFFHPNRGYWQTIGDVPQDILAGYPAGTVEVPLKPSAGAVWNGATWTQPPVEPSLPTLQPNQWAYFLDLTGFRDVLDSALAALPKSTLQERAIWAGMKSVAYASSEFELPVTLALVGQVRGMGMSGIPTDEEITAAWEMAALFQGAASLING